MQINKTSNQKKNWLIGEAQEETRGLKQSLLQFLDSLELLLVKLKFRRRGITGRLKARSREIFLSLAKSIWDYPVLDVGGFLCHISKHYKALYSKVGSKMKRRKKSTSNQTNKFQT